ncbi:MAG TPA: DUF2783 domain-containing protein [Burkholderiaceae bacterium]|nr:DUF2783 domain-containing protein [Burkholderiaceae bacterium]
MPLIRTPNIRQTDAFYQALIDAQRDMSDEQANIFSTKLVLILANHVGDNAVLNEAIKLAMSNQDNLTAPV